MFDIIKSKLKDGVGEWKNLLQKKKYSIDTKVGVGKKAVDQNEKENFEINVEGSYKPKYKQYLRFFIVITIIIFISIIYFNVDLDFSSKAMSRSRDGGRKLKEKNNIAKIELATESIKGASKWQSYFEDKIEEEKSLVAEQIESLKESLDESQKQEKNSLNRDLEEIKIRLSSALNELERTREENAAIQENLLLLHSKEEIEMPRNIDLQEIAGQTDIEPSVSSWNYIPATSIVEGYILGGLSVSTSINAASEPIPIAIKIKGRTNLPSDFAVSLNDCRILAGAYGDISSERAVVRAEQLICENKEEGLITNTKISGVIYGDDGLNGIRGNVVSMGSKHLKSAFVSGVLSGVTNVAKGREGLSLGVGGALSTSKKGPKELAEAGVIGGFTSASEKLADYHIKLAENISPVILVPSGTKVNIMFTKGVFVGSQGVKSKITRQRKKRGNHE